jgi:hypothetical protein
MANVETVTQTLTDLVLPLLKPMAPKPALNYGRIMDGAVTRAAHERALVSQSPCSRAGTTDNCATCPFQRDNGRC